MEPKSRIGRTSLTTVLIVIILLIVLFYVGWLTPIESATSVVLRPFQTSASFVTSGLKRLVEPFSSIVALQRENDQLIQRNNDLLVTSATLRQQLVEQEIIEEQITFLTSAGYDFATARVIGRTNDPSFQSININIGSTKGLRTGQAVVINNGVLVGIVKKVEPTHAEVLLINDSRSTINARIQNDSATPGTVNGQFTSSLKMDLIPQDKPVALNDYVVTSKANTNTPDGLLIGQVVEVKHSPGELFQTALLSPVANLESLTLVSVITSLQ
jgi:rod shape-determining protein MreC